jgi:glycosyltransferase involved in cell wall biosynthesis
LKIAIIGTRGIPANYGGFETFAQELSVRLAARGHEVWVYGRSHYIDRNLREFRDVKLCVLPSVTNKYLDTVAHTSLSVFHALFRGYDAVLVCNAANAFLCWVTRLFGQKTALNVDGIERLRKKWGLPGRLFYLLGERLALLAPNRIISDARVIQDYYRDRYGKNTVFIPYGAAVEEVENTGILDSLGLQEGKYLLYVSRLEPENNADLVIKAYLKSGIKNIPLVLVGSAPYAEGYLAELRRLADQGNVILPGAIYGDRYFDLLSHCTCYFQGSEVGGTHPALLEAMGAGAVVVSHDTPENREVLGDAGLICSFYDQDRLSSIVSGIAGDYFEYEEYGRKAKARVEKFYSWHRVTDQYESLFNEMVKKTGDSPDSGELR